MQQTVRQTHMTAGYILNGERRLMLPEIVSPVVMVFRNDQVSKFLISQLRKILSPDEVRKSLRFRFVHDRESYVILHGLLRMIIGRYLRIPPEEVEFTYNYNGKPSIAALAKMLHFNISHRAGVSALAFDPDFEIGVDVERMNSGFDFSEIVDHYFSRAEARFIFQSEDSSMKRFYELWTRKEAYLKAIGTGITENLRTEVILKTKHGPVSFEDGIIQKVFQFQSLLFGEDYLVTMAVAAGSGYLNTFFVRNVETYTSVITEA